MALSEIDMAISDLETSIERLHALYNQYFLGIERLEPTVQRKNVDRKIRALRRVSLHNTAQKFRLQTQIQKYNTHSNHWKRICRQIEEGTYAAHISLAKRRQAERLKREEEARQKLSAMDAGIDDSLGELDDISPIYELDLDGFGLDDPFAESKLPRDPIVVPRPKPANRPLPPPPPKAGFTASVMEKDRAAKIYRTYLKALKKCNQSTANVTLEKVAKSLQKKMEMGKGNMDFKVVIRKGKATIKAVKKPS